VTDDLAGWTPARRPAREVLAGARVERQPLDAQRHAADLFAAAQGGDTAAPDPRLWDFMGYGPFGSADEMAGWAAAQARSVDPLFFAVVDRATGRAGGMVSFLRIEPDHGCIEIGHIWFGAAVQRTPQATEAIYLLLRHAFDALGNRRVEWKCDAANARSRSAALRLGFTFEGVFRRHMVVKGRNRDTAWFSLLDHEWPAARRAFEAWLDPANFDSAGTQRRSLAALRAPDPSEAA
jgi:RimJ/RimL family protein N-acetyltransferase